MTKREEMMVELGKANYDLYVGLMVKGLHTHNAEVIQARKRSLEISKMIFEFDLTVKKATEEV